MGEGGSKTCGKIASNKLCDIEVKNKDGKTAAKFCTSCGCGDDPVPTPSPPDDKCKGDEDEIDLTEKGFKACGKIASNKLCDKEVKNKDGKTAAKFCTSCGCGEDPVPTPSPPDDKCKGDEDEIKLKEKGRQTCATIKSKDWCDNEVK